MDLVSQPHLDFLALAGHPHIRTAELAQQEPCGQATRSNQLEFDNGQSITYYVEIRMNKPNTDCPVCCPPDAPDTDLPAGEEADRVLASLARGLGHPARIYILRTLLDKAGCVAGELADELPLAPSTVSQHLKVLKQTGLIKGEVDGPRRFYCVDHAVLRRFKALVDAL